MAERGTTPRRRVPAKGGAVAARPAAPPKAKAKASNSVSPQKERPPSPAPAPVEAPREAVEKLQDDSLPALGEIIRCEVGKKEMVGKVGFVGPTDFAPNTWIGLVLDSPDGKNDGTVQGKRYFTALPQHGLFIKPHMILKGQAERALTTERLDSGLSVDSTTASTAASSTDKNSASAGVEDGDSGSTAESSAPSLERRQDLARAKEAAAAAHQESAADAKAQSEVPRAKPDLAAQQAQSERLQYVEKREVEALRAVAAEGAAREAAEASRDAAELKAAAAAQALEKAHNDQKAQLQSLVYAMKKAQEDAVSHFDALHYEHEQVMADHKQEFEAQLDAATDSLYDMEKEKTVAQAAQAQAEALYLSLREEVKSQKQEELRSLRSGFTTEFEALETASMTAVEALEARIHHEGAAAASRVTFSEEAIAASEAEVEALREELARQEQEHTVTMSEMTQSRWELEVTIARQATTATEEYLEDVKAEELGKRKELEAAFLAEATEERASEAAACRAAACEEERAHMAALKELEAIVSASRVQVGSLEVEVQKGKATLEVRARELDEENKQALNQQLQIEELMEQVEEHEEQRALVRRVSAQMEGERASVMVRKMELDALQTALKEEVGSCELQESKLEVMRTELEQSNSVALQRSEELKSLMTAASPPETAPRSEPETTAEPLEVQELREMLDEQEATCAARAEELHSGRQEMDALMSRLWQEQEKAKLQMQEVEETSRRALEEASSATKDLGACLVSQQELCRTQATELKTLHEVLSEVQVAQGMLEGGPGHGEPTPGMPRGIWTVEEGNLHSLQIMFCCGRPGRKSAAAAYVVRGQQEALLVPPKLLGTAGTGEASYERLVP